MYLLVILAVAVAAWLIAVRIAEPGKERWAFIIVGLAILAVLFWAYLGVSPGER